MKGKVKALKKGLFWVLTDGNGEQKLLKYTTICDKNGVAQNGQPAYNSKKGNSFSHEQTWPLLTENMPQKIKSKPWNYYPRGRVEIANGKATVYLNPVLLEWPLIDLVIIDEFDLKDFPVRFVPDHSKHYESKGDF